MRSLVFIPLLALQLMAGGLNWQSDYQSAQSKATTEKKKIFVFISTPECTWCKKLEATTLSDPGIVERLNAEYASVHVTRDVDAYPANLKAVVVPMCYFLASDGSVIDYARGFWDTTDFNLILNDVEKRLKKMKKEHQ